MNIVNSHRFSGAAQSQTEFNGFGNRSRSFDGTSDRVNIPASLGVIFTTGDFAISQWFKVEQGVNDFAYMLAEGGDSASQNKGFGTGIINGQVYGFIHDGVRLTFARTGGVYNDGQWHHRVDNFDRDGNWSCYVDGVLDASQDISARSSTITNGHDTNIGMYISSPINGGGYYEGKLSDVRAYDSLLSIGDISDLYAGTDVTANLVGHWLTDADNVLDAAGTNHGTNIGSKYSYDNPSPPVEFGSASRSFDGVNDSIDLGNSVKFGDGSNDNPFSVSAWIKMNDATKFRILGDWHDFGAVNSAFTFTTSGTNTFYLYLKDSSNNGVRARGYNFDMTSYEGEWIHVSATYNGVGGTNADQGIKLYLNGLRVDDESLIVGSYVAMEATTNNLEIGSVEIATGRDYADGKIADVRIYDTDLTASQISDLYAGTDVQTNLVGHWLTDNDDVEDKAGTNDGTNFGSTYSIDNPPLPLVPSRQASRDFDGTSDRVTIPANIFNGATTLTVSAWIKLDSLSINQTVIGRLDNNDGFRLMVRDTNQIDLIWGVGNSNFVSTLDGATLGSGSWIHVAGTFNNSGNATRYVDGAQTGTIDDLSSYGSLSILGDVGIGARVQTTSPLYNLPLGGKIADVRIYDAELTASQILDIYNGTTDRTNLVGQWLTNSDDVLDHAGNNDGTNNGSIYSTDSPS